MCCRIHPTFQWHLLPARPAGPPRVLVSAGRSEGNIISVGARSSRVPHALRSSGSSGRDSLDGVGLAEVSSVRAELAGDGAGLGGLSVREIVPMTRAPPAWAAMRSAMRVPSADRDGRARGSGSGGTSAGDGSRLSSGLTGVPSRLSGLGSRAFVNLGTKSMECGRSGVSLLPCEPVGDVARVGSMVVEPRADLITARVVQCGRRFCGVLGAWRVASLRFVAACSLYLWLKTGRPRLALCRARCGRLRMSTAATVTPPVQTGGQADLSLRALTALRRLGLPLG